MKIGNPEIVQQNDSLLCRIQISFSEGTATLWYSLSTEFADLVSDSSDAALVALLIPAMARGEDIYLDGTISEKLYYNLASRYQRVLQCMIPSLHSINIYPSNMQHVLERASGVATGFSAGIDSFCVLADHHYADVPTEFRLTHLLYNNVGAHVTGADRDADSIFNERYLHLKSYVAEHIGLPFIAINSNLDTFYKGFSFMQTHTPRNTSVALLLQRGIGRYMYASGYPYKDISIGSACSTQFSAYSDPITLPLLSTEALEAFSVGSEYTRVEKTLRVAEIKDSYKLLDVCTYMNKIRNCSTCPKCKKTLLSLEIAGVLDHYRDVFDLYAYQQGRETYMVRVLKSNDIFLREIVQFAKSRNFNFPLSAKLLAYAPKGEGVMRVAKGVRETVDKLTK